MFFRGLVSEGKLKKKKRRQKGNNSSMTLTKEEVDNHLPTTHLFNFSIFTYLVIISDIVDRLLQNPYR